MPIASRRPADASSPDLLECLFDCAPSYFPLRKFPAATSRGYLSSQLLFIRYLKTTRGISRVTHVERDHIVPYLTQAETRELCGRTRARRLGALEIPSDWGAHDADTVLGDVSDRSGVRHQSQACEGPHRLHFALSLSYRRLWGIS